MFEKHLFDFLLTFFFRSNVYLIFYLTFFFTRSIPELRSRGDEATPDHARPREARRKEVDERGEDEGVVQEPVDAQDVVAPGGRRRMKYLFES